MASNTFSLNRAAALEWDVPDSKTAMVIAVLDGVGTRRGDDAESSARRQKLYEQFLAESLAPPEEDRK